MTGVAEREAVRPEVLRDGVLSGEVTIVTGAGSGIGRAIARRLVALGAHVVGVGRHEDTLAQTGDGLSGASGEYEHEVVDVRDLDAATALVGRVGERLGITGLVNNAGGQFMARAEDISPRGWQAVVDLNLNAVFNLMVAAHPYLRVRGGSVVNLSLTGIDRGSMGFAHSIAARAGVLGLTRTLSQEWGPDAIRLNCIGPGTVVTGALASKSDERMLGHFLAATPLGRATAVEEVAELTAFLLSRAGQMMTGQLLQIDGGSALGPGLHGLPEAYER